jgi:hypothetical protein
MNIEYYKKHIYGLPALFVKDDQIARDLFRLTNRKTITQTDMNILSKLFSVTFTQVINP